MDRRRETFARTSFRDFLLQQGKSPQRWRRGYPRPDFYLKLGDKAFAVEVTRAMLTLKVGSQVRTQQGWKAALEGLTDRIEDLARERGILSGAYGMHLVPLPDFYHVESEVIQRALQYIEVTKEATAAPVAILCRRFRGTPLTISKVGPTPDQVGGVYFGPMKRDPDIHADLREILSTCLERKRKRLSRTRLPRILLIVDSYSYGDSHHWATVASNLDMRGFHTVARIGSGGCQVLGSGVDAWLKSAIKHPHGPVVAQLSHRA